MTDDLVKWLREPTNVTLGAFGNYTFSTDHLWLKQAAADRIEADAKRIAELERARNAQIAKALEHEMMREAAEARVKVLDRALHLWVSMMDDDTYDMGEMVEEFDRIARATLEGEKA